jgi:hypothetical protein
MARSFEANLKGGRKKLRRLLKRYPKLVNLAIAKAFDEHAFYFEGVAKQKLFSRIGGGTGATGVQGRTGTLSRSMGHKVRIGKTLKGTVLKQFIGGKRANYARIQEFGGTVRSTRPGGMLTVPLPDNLTARGVPRYKSARALFNDPSKNVFVVPSSGNFASRAVIGLKRGKRGKIKWLWVLLKQVKLQPRLGFTKLFYSRPMMKMLNRRVQRKVVKALRTGRVQ